MLRALGFLVLIAAATVAAVWFADHPGDVGIRWGSYAIDTTVAVLALASVLVTIVCSLIYHFWRWLRGGPRRLAESRAARRREQGYRTLTQGLVAVAAGDARGALRLGRESGRLIKNPLNLLLLAQAAQLDGDEAQARRHFGAMLEHSETEFLGLRGLLVQATKAGDWDAALDYARRAYALRPETEWVSKALFELEVRSGDWRAAQKTLGEAARHKHVGSAEAPRRRAVLLAERARMARTAGRDDEALSLARESHKLAPGLVAATALAGDLLAAAGKGRAAAKMIEDGWTAAPHPDLARVYAALALKDDPLQGVKRVERLTQRNPEHPESRIARAEAALAAALWGSARGQLQSLVEERPTQRVFRLLADVEERESGDADAVRRWLRRAATASPDAAWLCGKCGAQGAEWSARCDSCGAFDALSWSVPRLPEGLEAPVESRIESLIESPADSGPSTAASGASGGASGGSGAGPVLVVDAVAARE